MLLILDLLSTACFAGAAASMALRSKLSLVGVSLSAMIASTGGGTTREFILGSNTLFWLETPAFVLVVLTAILIAYLFQHKNRVTKILTKPADSFATATFIVVGVSAALNAQCNLLVCFLMGVLTGVGGGLIRQAVFDKASLRYNHINIFSAAYAALIGVILLTQNVNVVLVVVLLGFVHLSINTRNAIDFMSKFKFPYLATASN